MRNKLLRYLYALRSLQRVNISLSRGAAAAATRIVDLRDPTTWEFAGFSQNGEDGLLDVLTRHLRYSNRYFVEIGASDGLENNTTWLSMVRRFSGLWIEGNPDASERAKYLFEALNYGVSAVCMFVTRDGVETVLSRCAYTDPDVFSLDIDGNDYYVAKALLTAGLRPKVCVFEYNSAFGPDRSLTIAYDDGFRVASGHGANLYYGASITAWKKLLAGFGYRFVTTDVNGVNAVFVEPSQFVHGLLDNVRGRDFAENFSQLREHPGGWRTQFDLIASRPIIEV